MKKVICFALVYSLLLFTSCYYTKVISKDYPPFQISNVDIVVTLVDSSRYQLNKDEYRVKNDTILFVENQNNFLSKIPFEKIAKLSADVVNEDESKVVYLVVTITFIGLLLLSKELGGL